MTTISVAPAISDRIVVQLFQSITSWHSSHNQEQTLEELFLRVHLFGEVLPGWRIVQPLPVNIERDEDGMFVVSDDIFLVYGDGDSQSEAVNDYVQSLIELYQLVEMSAESNHFDVALLTDLQTYIDTTPTGGNIGVSGKAIATTLSSELVDRIIKSAQIDRMHFASPLTFGGTIRVRDNNAIQAKRD